MRWIFFHFQCAFQFRNGYLCKRLLNLKLATEKGQGVHSAKNAWCLHFYCGLCKSFRSSFGGFSYLLKQACIIRIKINECSAFGLHIAKYWNHCGNLIQLSCARTNAFAFFGVFFGMVTIPVSVSKLFFVLYLFYTFLWSFVFVCGFF